MGLVVRWFRIRAGCAARADVRTARGVATRSDDCDLEGRLVAYSGSGPIAFELCGAGQASCRFVRAAIGGSRVVIRSDDSDADARATRVRYCWGGGPICTLYDESGLPAGPFELPIDSPR